VVLQESVSGLGSFAVVSLPFTTASAGRLDTTVDWTLPDSSIAVYLVRGECTLDQLNARTCDFVNRMEASPFPKPHVLSADNVAAGTYELIVGNAGSEDESVSAQVVLSSATCPAVAAAGASRAPESGGGPREPWLSR
jgi:hypothetical protein